MLQNICVAWAKLHQIEWLDHIADIVKGQRRRTISNNLNRVLKVMAIVSIQTKVQRQ